MLQSELEHKNQQLEVKDKQIEELNARLAEVSSALVAAQQTAQAAQALHAGRSKSKKTELAEQSIQPIMQGGTPLHMGYPMCNSHLKP